MTIREQLRNGYREYFTAVPDAQLTVQYIYDYLTVQMMHTGNPFAIGVGSINGAPGPAFTEYSRIQTEAEAAKKKKKYASIPEVKVVIRPSKRRLSQPIFKPPFETWHDVSLRLHNTMIFIGSEPYTVIETLPDGKDYILVVMDKKGEKFKVPYYACDAIDLRSPEPQYFIYHSQPAFLRRNPDRRCQRQGFCYENSACTYVGRGKTFKVDDLRELMTGLAADPFPWTAEYSKLMQSQVKALRLSRDVAVYHHPTDGVIAEYKGRDLGKVNEDTVTVDEHDYGKPWIKQAVGGVNMQLRRG